MRAVMVSLAILIGLAPAAHGDPDPTRTVAVLEYRAGSSALPGIAARVVAALAKQTSLHLLGQDQTRAVYGAHLDQDLVRCAGDAACLARIGRKVGAAEIILIGISELGDVLLTMQRIDVTGRDATSRLADSLAVNVAPSDSQIASYTGRLLPPSDFLRFGVVDVVANLDGAAVRVGGKVRGITPLGALTLRAPATYDIRVDKPGYLPFATKVALPPEGGIKVEARLSRRDTDAWYQHWYVVVPVALVVAGASGTAIYFATRDTSSAGQIPVTGTIR